MDLTNDMTHGVKIHGAEDSTNYQAAPRPEHSAAGEPPVVASSATAGLEAGTSGTKKRGRPRKYGPGGAISRALMPMPISISAPPTSGDFSGNKPTKGGPVGSTKKPRERVGLEDSGDNVASSGGGNLTPHVILVNTGEDVSMRIIALSQQGPRAIFIMSAVGWISNVTIRGHDPSCDTVTYEDFIAGSFSHSFIEWVLYPVEVEGSSSTSRAGGIGISLVGADGHVIGGILAGLLIAASPVQVTVGSFLPNAETGLKPKKQKTQTKHGVNPPGFAATTPPSGEKGVNAHEKQNSSAPSPNLASSSTSGMNNWAAMQHIPDPSSANTDINISLEQ